MKSIWPSSVLACCFSLLAILLMIWPGNAGQAFVTRSTIPALSTSWYFTVSGDSRDCGDLIVPKIAQFIADHPTNPPVSFYWHLGDFRALYRVDCDIAKRDNPAFRCVPRKASPDETVAQKKLYSQAAWNDFIKVQLAGFSIPVLLGIGNHELIDHTRADYRDTFERWLKHNWIQKQREADQAKQIDSQEGDTFYHFIKNGVDFIYLDNAAKNAFLAQEIEWLFRVLDADTKDDSVKTIIVGMHEALPGSTSSNHAMDDGSCEDICQAQKVYDRLYEEQNLDGATAKRKHVYVLASHSHFFRKNIYNTSAHKGHVLPGWIVGTAGAEQYQNKIQYGYLQVEVRSDGTINAQFKKVGKTDPPIDKGKGGQELTDYCFGQNSVPAPSPSPKQCPKCQ